MRPAPAPTKVPVPPKDAQPPAPRTFVCLYCRKPVRATDVVFFNGETACPPCFQKQSRKRVTVACRACGHKSPPEEMVLSKEHHYCPSCADQNRIEYNREMKVRRQALQSARVLGNDAPPRIAGKTAWILASLAILVVAGIVVAIAWVTVNGIHKSSKPATVMYVLPSGKQIELPPEVALKRLEEEPAGYIIDSSGIRRSHDDSIQHLRR